MIRVMIPHHLRTLAGTGAEVSLNVAEPATSGSVLDALEATYPVLGGTIRGHVTLEKRPFLRFFVCMEDWSHEPPDKPLPEEVATGAEAFYIIGAIAGG